MAKPFFTGSEWTFDLLKTAEELCAEIATEELRLDLYPNQIEVISSDQMLDAYSSIGMPVMYKHWSYGKHYVRDSYNYNKGFSGLAYEIVINSCPTINYLMEENTMTMQTLVIAHAAFGHNSFFKNNELFKQWTNASEIVDYLAFAKDYISKCEEKYGFDAVEQLLDSCHAIMNFGVDRYARPVSLSASEEQAKQAAREAEAERSFNDIWRTLPGKNKKKTNTESDLQTRQTKLGLPEENLMYFIEKKSPTLETWQREIVRIVRKISQYFYPQKQTQVSNEGWASFTHYYIMTRLHEKGLITDGSYLEFLHSHTSVVYQLPYNHPRYSGFNPYALGYGIYTDIKRMCQKPTLEDAEWFPDIVGTDWVETCQYAMKNFRDESFISQYLSPKMIRDWHLFEVHDNSNDDFWKINKIHNERGYKKIRSTLSAQYNISNREPDIQVWDVNFRGDRKLELRHNMHDERPLSADTKKVLYHIQKLWGYDVSLASVDPNFDEIITRYNQFK